MKEIEAKPMLSFTEALKESTSNVFRFTGRARRSEYWWTMLVVCLAELILNFCGILSVLNIFLSLAVIPLTFRRLHDTGRSGWWWGIGAIMKGVFIVVLLVKVMKVALGSYNDEPDDFDDAIVFAMIGEYLIYALIICLYHLVLLIFLCLDGSREENRYGASPKYKSGEMTFGNE